MVADLEGVAFLGTIRRCSTLLLTVNRIGIAKFLLQLVATGQTHRAFLNRQPAYFTWNDQIGHILGRNSPFSNELGNLLDRHFRRF